MYMKAQMMAKGMHDLPFLLHTQRLHANMTTLAIYSRSWDAGLANDLHHAWSNYSVARVRISDILPFIQK
jgi:hypothetical protein